MKKAISAITMVMATIALAICMTACSTAFKGTYKFYSMSMESGGVSLNYEVGKEYMGMTISEDAYVLEIKDDNTWTMTMNLLGEQDSATGTWEESDGKYYLLTTGSNEKQEVKVDGKKITFEEDGAKIVLKK